MAINTHRLALIKHKQLAPFIDFALREGWQIKLSSNANIQLKKKGYSAIYNAAFLIEAALHRDEQHCLPIKKDQGGKNGK